MLKRNKRWMLIGLCCGFIGLSSLAIRGIGVKEASAYKGELTNCLVRDSYILNEPFTLPSAELKYNEQTKTASESILVYPDGRAVAKDECILTDVGEYKLIYSADFNGKIIKGEKSFNVNANLYSVGDEEKSSVQYGTSERYEDVKDVEGIVLDLAKGDTFYYNKVIDLTKKQATDTILEFFAVPFEKGTCDAQTVIVRLTDAYNADNYVEIEIKNASYLGSWADPVVYCTANAVGQPKSGMTTGEAGAEWCRQDSWAGTMLVTSLCGSPSPTYYSKIGEDAWGFSMDYENRGVYGQCGNGALDLIMDLDNAKYLDTLWNGFTTGEAFLSITASRYISGSAQYVITDINGDDLSKNEFYAQNNVKIDVDFGDYTRETLPSAVVGKEYPLFGYKTMAATGSVRYSGIAVYYDYYSATPISCNVENGRFTPTREGEYSVVYYAEDSFGQTTREVVSITAEERAEMEALFENIETTGKLGDLIKVVDNIRISNNTGNVSISINIKDENGHSYVVDEKSYMFRPQYAGRHAVEIIVSDYLSTISETFEIDIKAQAKAYIGSELVLPKYLIKGATYTFPSIMGCEYSTGKPIEIETEIYLKEDNGSEIKLAGNDYKVAANQNVRVIYRSVNDGEKAESYKDIRVVDVGYNDVLKLANYFPTDGGVISSQGADFISLSTTTENAQTTFANAVNGDEIYLVWKFNKNKTSFGKVTFVIEDYKNENIKAEFTFVRNGKIVDFYLNGVYSYRVSEDYDINNPKDLECRYVNSEKAVYPVRDRAIPVRKTVYGDSWEGLTKAYIGIRFSDVVGESGIDISVINRQGLVDTDKDFFSPQIAVASSVGDKKLGERISLKGAIVADVLDPVVTSTIKVIDPAGNYVRSEDGVLLDGTCDVSKDYSFIVSQYGEYEIAYSATDALSGRTTKYSYGITVVDSTAPIITLKNVKTEFKASEKITIASAVAEDDMDGKTAVYIYIKDPTGKISMLTGDFTPSTKGTYEVIYTSYDVAGNMATVSYKFKVV